MSSVPSSGEPLITSNTEGAAIVENNGEQTPPPSGYSLNISLAAEPIFKIGDFSVSNSMLTGWVVTAFLIVFALLSARKITVVPGKIQNFAEIVIDGFFSLVKSVAGENATKFFPIVATFFFFILFSNWFGLLPGVGSIGLSEIHDGKRLLIPFFRSASADLNTTIALALISVFVVQFYGISEIGVSAHLGKFIKNPLKGPIDFFVGILELVLEFAKIISFAFRLFGNIFAGEVLLTVITFLVPVLIPLPFLGLEVFVGLIQALVFALLTLVFIQMATIKHGDSEHHLKEVAAV